MMARSRYTAEHLEFLREGYASMLLPALTTDFNSRFGTAKTETQIKSTLTNHKITCGRKTGKTKGRYLLFTGDEAGFLKENYKRFSLKHLVAEFNNLFPEKTEGQIRSFTRNHGVKSGRTGHFEKGQESWNLGKKGYMGANLTSFKKGNAPANKKPLWSERVDSKDGFILMKVPERDPHTGFPTRYKHKHVWIWEQANGPVPGGHAVVFRDSDKLNCQLENLMLLTRAELLVLNLHGYREFPGELKPSVLALARVEAKAGIRTRPGRGRKSLKGESCRG